MLHLAKKRNIVDAAAIAVAAAGLESRLAFFLARFRPDSAVQRRAAPCTQRKSGM